MAFTMSLAYNVVLVYAGRFFLAITFLVVTFASLNISRNSRSPPHIPWVGLKNRRCFPKFRACFSELWTGRSMIDEGWEKYSKHNLPFVLPGMGWNAVVLPPSNAAWLAQQPDSIISGNTALDELMGLPYLAHGPTAASCRDFTVIRRDLTRNIMKLSDQIYDEIQAAFDEELKDVGEEWEKVDLHKVVLEVSFRSANRIFVGLPMCRDKKYKRAIGRWTTAFGTSILITRFLVPEGLKQVFMRLAAIPTKIFQWYAGSFFIGIIKKRLATTAKKNSTKQNDILQWIIDQNATKKDAREMDPWNIAGKMILFNIFATSTIGMQTGTTLVNLLCCPNASSILSELYAKASSAMPGICKDPRQVREMWKLDSLIRETLRCHPVTPQGLVRQVVEPGGITTPDGVYLSRGTHVQCIVRNMQRDPDIFGDEAAEYDPLRWSSPPTLSVNTSPDFLSWGLGRHTCPGRFFAVHVMKLMLGHLVAEYELEPLVERPKFVELAGAEFPSEEVMVRLRRRMHCQGATTLST